MATTSLLPPLSSSSSSPLPPPSPPPLLPLSSSSSDSEDDNDTSYLNLPDDEADVDLASALDPRDASTPDHWVPRHPSLIRLTGRHPFNTEAPLPLLLRHGFLTPSPIHFVRNHGHVPLLPHDHRLHLSGLVLSPSSFSASDLALRFRPRELPVTLVCAGNRRREQNLRRQSLGFNWGPTAVSTAVWRGARLRDVLLACGVRLPTGGRRRYVWFEGAEDLPGGGGKGSKYGTSLRLEVAMAKESDVILAYAMNGRALPPDHGYPVRLVVPGYIGGRMVKWLTRVVVADEESPNHYHYKDNRVLPSHVDAALADSEGWWYKPEYIINELNINSAITTPSHDEMFAINSVTTKSPYTIRGYAYSGGGRKVTRVEVTMDGGETWKLCELEHPERPTKYGKYWCWCFWSIHVEVLDLLGAQEIAVRAWDESQNTQPEKLTWNVMGMMNNCWFRVKIIPHRPARGEIGLLFEHPTVPGTQAGGWMMREKHPSPSSSLPPSSDLHSPKKTLPAPSSSPRYTLSEVCKHSSRDSAWIVVHGVVYDCTPFLKDHPGGADSILINAGTDCTEDFDAIHSDKAKAMLDDYRIGELLPMGPTTPSPAPSITTPSSGPVALTSPREKINCTLVSKTSIAHNVRLFRFALPSTAQLLGLPVGKHVLLGCTIDGKRCMRAYTPTSHADEVGHFDLVVKIYEHGLMSRHLDALPVGSAIYVKGPAGHVEYRGRGELVVHGETRHVRKVAMVAGGTGVTPMYQVMQAAAGDEGDETEMRLVFANRSEGDVFMRREIDGCVEKGRGRVSVRHVVGKVTGEVLGETVPPWVKGETLALVCGPPGMAAAVKEGLLGKLGYDEDSVVVF